MNGGMRLPLSSQLVADGYCGRCLSQGQRRPLSSARWSDAAFLGADYGC